VLLLGESGTGKGLVARHLHTRSRRRAQPFVRADCTTLIDTLIESTLFGHEKGAFTGASERQLGAFDLAGAGTLFLDEIGEMPLSQQAKLLGVLEDRSYRPIGSRSEVHLEARVIAATLVDLHDAVARRAFREDLYHRLRVMVVRVPPLRERLEDIPALVDELARRSRPVTFTSGALRRLSEYHWPGNVRELRNAVERVTLLGEGDVIDEEAVLRYAELDGLAPAASDVDGFLRTWLAPRSDGPNWRLIEEATIRAAVALANGNMSAAARRLGMDRETLRRKLRTMHAKCG
jgi:DNA-binding NtrC family response regulator